MAQLCTFVMTENIPKLKRYCAFYLLRPIRKMEKETPSTPAGTEDYDQELHLFYTHRL